MKGKPVASIEEEILQRFMRRLADGGIDEEVLGAIADELESEEKLSAERLIGLLERQEGAVGQ